MNRHHRRLLWRRHAKLPVAMALLVGVLLTVGGRLRVIPLTTARSAERPLAPIGDIAGKDDLFSADEVHRVTLTVAPLDWDKMIKRFVSEQEKIVVEGSITIDGTTIDRVGVRLKGNSSLDWILASSSTVEELNQAPAELALAECLGQAALNSAPPPEDGAFPPEDGAFPPEDAAVPPEDAAFPPEDAAFPPEDGAFPPAPIGDPTPVQGPTASDYPLLIEMDAFVAGQRYQGITELAIRVSGIDSVLREIVAFDAFVAAGLPTGRGSLATASVNGAPTRLVTLAHVPEQAMIDRLFPGSDGALFKATSEQQQGFAYVGDDPASDEYQGFDQITGRKRFDRAQLIKLIRFVATSSDVEFEDKIASYIDVASLARISALNNLLENWDSFGRGPGGNYYLYFDTGAERFNFVPWDYNLAMGGLGEAGILPWEEGVPADVDPQEADPATDKCFADFAAATGQPDLLADPAAGGVVLHPLAARLQKSPDFLREYASAQRDLKGMLLTRGLLRDQLTKRSELMRKVGQIDPSAVEEQWLDRAVAEIDGFLRTRATKLASADSQ